MSLYKKGIAFYLCDLSQVRNAPPTVSRDMSLLSHAITDINRDLSHVFDLLTVMSCDTSHRDNETPSVGSDSLLRLFGLAYSRNSALSLTLVT